MGNAVAGSQPVPSYNKKEPGCANITGSQRGIEMTAQMYNPRSDDPNRRLVAAGIIRSNGTRTLTVDSSSIQTNSRMQYRNHHVQRPEKEPVRISGAAVVIILFILAAIIGVALEVFG